MARSTPEQRARELKAVKFAYEKGLSVRTIAEDLGVSYGKAHKLLQEAGVEFRPRGGANNAGART